MKNKIFACLKRVYKSIPLNYKVKNKLKGIFYRFFGFAFKNTASYRVWSAMNMEAIKQADSLSIEDTKYKNYECSKKIAVQLHLYYIDLLNEMVDYLKKIPFHFDVLVSISDKEKKNERMIDETLKKIDNVVNVYITDMPNQGRDVAPLISIYAEKVLEYDFICHIHTKKSLYSGSEQEEWRRYLFDSLLGNSELVKSHLFQLEKGEKIGLIYPETFEYLPYYGHSWLKNKFARNELLNRIKVNVSSFPEYIEYPMGTMFWASVKALKQFFEAKISMNEFDKEMGQKDGTLAHAFERCVGLVCNYNGYNTLILDKDRKSYSYNYGKKNMNQYWIKSYDNLKEELKSYDVVSFDIFDTLVSRNISDYRVIIRIVEKCIDDLFGTKSGFNNIRVEAEASFRNKNTEKDCDIDEIYKEIMKISKLDSKILEYAKNLELQLEDRFIIPKKQMIEVLKFAKNTINKKVYLISDMHLRREDIEKILLKNDITDYDKLLLSSEMDMRKDNGTMWEYFAKENAGLKCIHIGDNEVADVQEPEYKGITNYHVLSDRTLFQLSNIGKLVNGVNENNVLNSIELGLIYNELCLDPFKYNKEKFKIEINDANQLGYVVFGPIILNYVLWLTQEAKKKNSNKILFLARDGYVLKMVYDELIKGKENIYPKSEYVLVSRRALSFASIYCENDIYEPLKIYYEGKLDNLLSERYGINIENEYDEDIKLPDDCVKVKKILEKFKDLILERAKEEREQYISYINKIIENDESIVLSDIGYGGTIQYYLSKLTGRAFYGCYIATDDAKKPLKIDGNSIIGYYIDNDSEQEISNSNVHRYHLLLEAILIAPFGQFLRLDKKGNSEYLEDNQLYNETIEKIHNGIKRYAEDFRKVSTDIPINDEPDRELSEKLIKAVVKGDILSQDIVNNIKMEDKYCGGGYRNPVEYYKNRNL